MEQQVVEDTKMHMRRPFDPAAHDLDPHFRLTRFADLKGWGCKVPQEVLLKLLEGLQQEGAVESEQSHFQYVGASPHIGKWPVTHWVCTLRALAFFSWPTSWMGTFGHAKFTSFQVTFYLVLVVWWSQVSDPSFSGRFIWNHGEWHCILWCQNRGRIWLAFPPGARVFKMAAALADWAHLHRDRDWYPDQAPPMLSITRWRETPIIMWTPGTRGSDWSGLDTCIRSL